VFLCGFVVLLGWAMPSPAAEKATLPDFLLRTWDSDDGLPAGQIRATARTPDGYLWIATTAGLARFDGSRFVVFSTNTLPALGDNRVLCLLVDRAGDLWVGTGKGTLARRHDGVIAAVPLDARLGPKPIYVLAQDAEGAIWLATQGAGLVRCLGGSCAFFSATNGLPRNVVSELCADKQGQIWAIAGAKLATFKAGRWDTVKIPGISFPLAALAPSSDGGLWVATIFPSRRGEAGGQVFKLIDGLKTLELPPFPWPHGTMYPNVNTLVEDQTGRIWLGTGNAGLLYWGPEQGWDSLSRQSAPRQISINCLSEDQTGNLWVGFDRTDELMQIRPRPVNTLHLPAPAEQSRVFAVCAARDNSVWVGTSDAGVFRYRQGEFEHFGSEQGLLAKNISVIFEDRRTNLFVGTWTGLFRWNTARFERVEGPSPLRSRIYSLCEDRQGNLWVGTPRGAVRLGDTGAQLFGRDEGLGSFDIMAIEEDRAGVIWVATVGQGIFRLRQERFEACALGPALGHAVLSVLYAGPDNALWIGTWGQGLLRLKDGTLSHWNTTDGLPSDLFHAIIEDEAGNLWFSSDNGFFGCLPRQFDTYAPGRSAPLSFRRLSTGDGFDSKLGSGAGHSAAARSADGRLWFPNQYALAVLDLTKLPSARLTRSVMIEEVLVDGAVCPRTAAGGLRVKSSSRRFDIHYTAPSLLAPEQTQFRFRLVGWDPQWIDASRRRVAYYGHLPPGEYRFEVMAGGLDGVWREATPGLQLEVVPRWWERRWAQALGALLLIGSLVGGLRMAERAKLRRRLRELQTQQALEGERRRIAQDLHDDIGARLTRLGLQGALAGQEGLPAAEVRREVAGMTDGIRELVAAIDEVVWTINPRQDSVASLTRYIQHYAAEFFEPMPVRCRVDIQSDLPEAPLGAQVRHNLFLAVKEALHNAAKHSRAGEVWLTVQCQQRTLAITVEDDGRGFDAVAARAEHNGLANMRARLKGAGGECVIESQPGKGCRVGFRLPL